MKESRRRFSVEEYEERKLKVLTAMTRHQLDLLVITDPANMCWLTGYDAWSFYVHQCVVLSGHGDLFWFGRGIDVASAQLTTDIPAGRSSSTRTSACIRWTSTPCSTWPTS